MPPRLSLRCCVLPNPPLDADYSPQGRIDVGSDADIVIWDGAAKRTISAKTHHHKVDYNIFEGMKIQGIAAVTITRGKVAWENGELKCEQGWGRFVPRKPFGPVFDGIETRDEARDLLKRKVDRPPYDGPVWTPESG